MAKVKTLESSREFLALVEKSGLLTGDKLEAARQACGATEDAKVAARQLLKNGLLTNWQVNQLLGGFAALVVGNYKLLDQIGKGELGKVYLAEHVKMNHRVAFKTLASKSIGDPKIVERFVAEARAASEFEHQNILRVLDVAGEGDRPFVATEFVAGGDLQQRVDKSGPIPPRDAVDFITQAAEGLAYVHGKNVLHRDLKPANLMVDEKGVVKILDVGVGQLRQAAKPGNESTGEILMSALGYMSPEQVRGKEMDKRSDIYALGGTLYFLLCGRMPYTATSDEERELIKKTKRPVPVAAIKPDVPADLAKLVDQAMALRPAERPASMEDFAKSLRAFAESAAGTSADANAKTVSASTTLAAVEPVAHESLSATFEFDKQTLADTTAAMENLEPLEAKPASAKTEVSDTTAMLVAMGGAAVTPALADLPSGFKIHKKKKELITQSLATAPDAIGEKGAAEVLNRAKRQKLLLIVTGAISIVIMILSIVVYSIFGVSDSGPAVAAAGDSGAAGNPATEAPLTSEGAATGKQKADPAADPSDPENTPDPEMAPPPTVAAPPAAAVPTATAPVVAAPPTATAPVAAPAPTPAAPASGANTTPAAATPPVAPAAPTATVPAPAAPATTPAPMPVAPAAPPTAPPATEAKKETPPPTPPVQPKPPTPAKAPPSGKTFEIANAVDLPRLPSADGSTPAEAPTKVLGRVNIDAKDTCFLAMIGGERAMKGKNTFAIRNAQGGVALRDWEITQKSSTEEIVIATLALPTNELKFDWTPDGLKNAAAPFLKNCAIKITAGQDKPHLVAFRTPLISAPTKLENLEKATISAKFALESLPDGASLRMEPIVPGQRMLFDAGGGGDITKGDQWIFFGESKEQAPLALKLDTSTTSKGITITLAPFMLIPGEQRAKFNAAARKKWPIDAMKSAKTQLDGNLGQLEKSKDKDKLQNQINLTRLERDLLDKKIAQVERLNTLVPQLDPGGKVHFRIYYEATDSSGSAAAQIELVKTDDNAPAK